MKALISIQFAVELENEDDLVTLARQLDQGMLDGIKARLESGMDRGGIELRESLGMIDWYGANVSVKKSVFEYVEGGD